MADLDAREQAQLGLKKIQDAIVMLLSREPDGLSTDAVARHLGLADDLPPGRQNAIAAAVLELLLHSGRVLRDGKHGIWLDNPEKG